MGIKTGKKNLILMLLIGILGMCTEADAESWQWSISDDFGPARAPAKSEIDWETHPVGWSDDRRLIRADPYESAAVRPLLANDINGLHMVWCDMRNGNPENPEIYYKRSADGGKNWTQDQRLTFANGESFPNALVTDRFGLHLIWSDERDGNREIYYKKSSDGGMTWTEDRKLSNTLSESCGPTMTSETSELHLVWTEGSYEKRDQKLLYKKSEDGGKTWSPSVELVTATGLSWSPFIMSDEDGLHLFWSDDRESGIRQIYYMKSTDGGKTWSQTRKLTDGIFEAVSPSAVADEEGLHLFWEEYVDTITYNSEIYYMKSIDGGINWEEKKRLTYGDNLSWLSSATNDIYGLHLVWSDWRTGDEEIYYKMSEDGGINWTEDLRLTFAPSFSEVPNLVSIGGVLHLVWCDERYTHPIEGKCTGEIFYKFYDPTPPTGRMTKPEILNLYNDIGDVTFVSEIGTFEDPESRYMPYCNVQLGGRPIGSDQELKIIFDEVGKGNMITFGGCDPGYTYYCRFRVLTETYRWSEWSEWSDGAEITGEPCENVLVYPNPCRLSVQDKVIFDNLDAWCGSIWIYTINGEEVWYNWKTGESKAVWDLRNEQGEKVSSGIYIYRIYYTTLKGFRDIVPIHEERQKTGKIAIIR